MDSVCEMIYCLLIKTCLKYLGFVQVTCFLIRPCDFTFMSHELPRKCVSAPFAATRQKETQTTRKHITGAITMTGTCEVSLRPSTILFTMANIMYEN
jgi:hypothetical protein